jgi:branched-chain amino acid transport system substrate-binding protein
MSTVSIVKSLALGTSLSLFASLGSAHAQETIKLGLSVPLSGAAATWGEGAEWLCEKAAEEIEADGGVQVGGEVYNFECVAYDNKYNAADGTRVAQTLLNREGVKFIGGSLGTAPVQALQSLTERQGVLLFTVAWGESIKGPDYPLTFTAMNTPNEILPPLINYVAQENPDAQTVALLNPNDATGKETEAEAGEVWQEAGLEVVSSDFYERGTTEFQPIAAKLASLDPDVIALGSTPPADAGVILKELDVLGWDGVKVLAVGTGLDALKATGGDAVNGVYMGAAVTFEGEQVSDHQRELNEQARAVIGESLNAVQIGFYDAVYALKAAMESAQSIEPQEVASELPNVSFRTFYGGEASFGGEDVYGSPQQILVPVIITQIQDGKVVEVERVPVELTN